MRGRVVLAAVAVGLVPTAALAAPAAFEAWDSYRADRQYEALARKSRPAVDALRRVEVPGLAPCAPRPDDHLGTCLASATGTPLDAAGRARDALRAAGATDVVVECFRSKRVVACRFTGTLRGMAIGGYAGPRVAGGTVSGVEVVLHVDPAPGTLSFPGGAGTPVPVP